MEPYTFLIVDDQAEIIELYEEFPGSKILKATNGQEGLEVLKNFQVTLVISDFKMPKMNGTEMIKLALNQIPHTKNIPFIIISGYLEDAKANVETGKIYFLDKPLELSRLRNVIQLLLKAT